MEDYYGLVTNFTKEISGTTTTYPVYMFEYELEYYGYSIKWDLAKPTIFVHIKKKWLDPENVWKRRIQSWSIDSMPLWLLNILNEQNDSVVLDYYKKFGTYQKLIG